MIYAMDLIQYILILLVCFLGIAFGFILSLIAPEELRQGKRYFDWLARILIFLIMLFFIMSTTMTMFPIIFLVIVILIVLFARKSYLDYLYPLMGIVILLTVQDINVLVIESSLIFILGLVIASLFMVRFEKDEKISGSKTMMFLQLLLRYVLFLIIGLLFFLFS